MQEQTPVAASAVTTVLLAGQAVGVAAEAPTAESVLVVSLRAVGDAPAELVKVEPLLATQAGTG